jgi:poly-gamma-glutamate capsule biosynthesis protein CapA/YwtB (metallophosphatase superfamily)
VIRRRSPIILFVSLLAAVAAVACSGDASPTSEPGRTLTPRPGISRTPQPSEATTDSPTAAEGTVFAVVDAGTLPAGLDSALRQAGTVDAYASLDEAQSAAAGGDQTFVVLDVPPGAESSSNAAAIYAQPVALYVPFTFRLEGVDLQGALGLLDGSVTEWAAVGGPATPVESTPTADHLSTGQVAALSWDGPHLRAKTLAVDGLLPTDAGYPLADRWVILDAPKELAAALTIPAAGPDYITVAAVGDMMFARTVGEGVAANGPGYPFGLLHGLLNADITFGNLECVLSDRGTPADKGFTFEGDPAVAGALAKAGFDVVSVANNHSMDYGPDAFLDTLANLDTAGIERAGGGQDSTAAHTPAILEAHGLRIAFLAYGAFVEEASFPIALQKATDTSPGIAWIDPGVVAKDVAAARRVADIVVVSMHSGLEYTSGLWQTQIDVAHEAIDAGAALVLGSGPHVLQGIEYYGDGVIAYSLGNFIFDFDDQDRAVPGMPSAHSGVLVASLDAKGVRGLEFRPAVIAENRPEPAPPDEAPAVYDWFYPLVDALAP